MFLSRHYKSRSLSWLTGSRTAERAEQANDDRNNTSNEHPNGLVGRRAGEESRNIRTERVGGVDPNSRRSGLNPAEQKQDDQNNQNQAQSAARVISPTPAVRPGRERAEQHQNEQHY